MCGTLERVSDRPPVAELISGPAARVDTWPDHWVRPWGARGPGDTEHVAAVRDRLDDEDPEGRRQAARALSAMQRRLP
jgi:hypothetical protein